MITNASLPPDKEVVPRTRIEADAVGSPPDF